MEDHFPLWSRKKYGYDFLRGAIRLSILQVVQSLAARRLPPLGTSLEKWPRDGSSPPRCEKGEGTRGPDPFTFTLLSRRSSTIFFVLSVFFSRKKKHRILWFLKDCVCFFLGFSHISYQVGWLIKTLFLPMDFLNGHRLGGQEIETQKNYLQYLFCLPGSCQKFQPQWPLWEYFFLDFSLGLLGSMVIGSMGYFTEKLMNG